MSFMFKFLTVVQAIILLYSCNGIQDKQEFFDFKDTSYPYGEWKSAEGFRIIINEDNTYRVCFLDDCDKGKVELFGAFGIKLLDFFDKEAAVTLMNDSGYTYYNSLKSEAFKQKNHFDFTPNVGSRKTLLKYCNNNPCTILGYPAMNYIFILKR